MYLRPVDPEFWIEMHADWYEPPIDWEDDPDITVWDGGDWTADHREEMLFSVVPARPAWKKYVDRQSKKPDKPTRKDVGGNP